MYRRALLTTTAIAAASIAGCVDGGDPTDDGSGGAGDEESVTDSEAESDSGTESADADESDGDDESESSTADVEVADDPDARSVDVSEIDPAEAGAASIEFVPDAVHVEGTVVGETGCHGIELASTGTTDEDGFRVVVAAVDEADPDEMCTQAMTDIGYEVDAEFADGVPESVTVVHDDAGGREVVATDSPDE